MRVFAEGGFHATSMNDLADDSWVTKPVLYQHFSSKRALYRELLDDVGARLLDEITKATLSAPGPREQVELGFAAYFRFVADNGDSFRLFFGGGTRRDEEFAAQVTAVEGAIADAIADLIEVEGFDHERRRLLAHGLVGLAEATSRLWSDEGSDVDPDELSRQVADLAWRGLRGLGRSGHG